MDRQDRPHYLLLSVMLLVLGGLFVLRGPVRALGGGSDLVHLYAAVALWAEGGDPYDGEQCVDRLLQAGYHHPAHVADGSLYPPSTLAALSPLALLDWSTARLVWLVLNLGACGVLVWSASQWLAVRDAKARWLLAALLVVAMGAVATTLWLGQLALVAAAGVCAGVVCVQRGRVWSAGVLIGLACAIKPQMGLGFLVLLGVLREWRALALGLGVVVALSGLAVGRLMLTAPNWWAQLNDNIAQGTKPGGILDASATSNLRHQMVDLRPLLHAIVPANWVGPTALLIVSGLAAAALMRLIRLGLREHLLLAVSGVGLLLMMPAYHRQYDAVLLLPLLVLIVNTLMRERRDGLMWVIGVAVLPILFPTPALLATLANQGRLPESLTGSALWTQGVMLHHAWGLLIAAVALVIWTWRLPLPEQSDERAEASGSWGSTDSARSAD